jgi:hypothetical protein
MNNPISVRLRGYHDKKSVALYIEVYSWTITGYRKREDAVGIRLPCEGDRAWYMIDYQLAKRRLGRFDKDRVTNVLKTHTGNPSEWMQSPVELPMVNVEVDSNGVLRKK